jgi:hypothetical protein
LHRFSDKHHALASAMQRPIVGNGRSYKMRQEVIEISTEVFHFLQKRVPAYISLADEKPGPTQKILVAEEVYTEFIDRAIAHHRTLDQVVREAWVKSCLQVLSGSDLTSSPKRMKQTN